MTLTTSDLICAAPHLYRQMLDGWQAGGMAYPEHRPRRGTPVFYQLLIPADETGRHELELTVAVSHTVPGRALSRATWRLPESQR